jgi:hypothetical protein
MKRINRKGSNRKASERFTFTLEPFLSEQIAALHRKE